ncbi:CST complex subunit TEN1 isoform X3 [Ovis canadensis]|uniref:CST complex subunit TEN1 isoform X3 n=1 Tax=Ovis canadensis TaxID=37174 RepID=UPI0038B636C9
MMLPKPGIYFFPWEVSAGQVPDGDTLRTFGRRKLRGEGPGADVCGRNEPPLVRTSHPGAEAVPAREGQRPVESKPRAPGSTTFPPGQMLELLQRRCRSIPQVTAFVWRDEGRGA